ncbi:hypothetical protein [Phenylobacterium sp.]|uniref:hypothetical protein n=1 Tax=Phenylobacterium sp. TaxID=1871053 RepID=UPI002ED9C285
MTNALISPGFADRSPSAQAVDNVLRRVLKVRDPADSSQVAKALLDRYGDQANQLMNERSGLPVVSPVIRAITPAVMTQSYGPELVQAYDDFNRDIAALMDDSTLKDIRPELEGWSRAIRLAAEDGMSAARFALDPRQRDRVFSARRQLGDYARLARYVGALTPDCNSFYRRLAQSCDVLSGLMLVLVGDGLAALGVTRSTVILQAPASELVERREAAINALRVLVGSTREAYGQNDWPRGLESYRRLMAAFDSAGQSDLRALFNEQTLARTLDELIDMAASNTSDGLRALGSASVVTIERLQRLVNFAQATYLAQTVNGGRLIPESPPLASLLSALALFVEAFNSAGGAMRLLYVARPPLIFYGLYGFGGPDEATRRLLRLVQLRGTLAEEIDCFLECNCDDVECQLMLDKVLYDVDRAVDLYCLGSNTQGEGDPERRAAAFGAVTVALLAQPVDVNCLLDDAGNVEPRLASLYDALNEFAAEVQWPFAIPALPPFPTEAEIAERLRIGTLIHSEICLQRASESRWARLVETLAPACRRDLLSDARNPVRALLQDALDLIDNEMDVDPAITCPAFEVTIPPNLETSLNTIANDVLADGT